MYVTRWRLHGVALAAAALAGCSDSSAPTEVAAPPTMMGALSQRPVALLSGNDPTAIPIGSPTMIEFSGSVRASRRVYTAPRPAPPVDLGQFAQTAAEWVMAEKARGPESRDPDVARALKSIEQLLASRTPEEIRAALGPRRSRVTSTRSFLRDASGLVEHTASYRVDGQKVLRVVTLARASEIRATMECVDDPTGLEIDPSEECGYDPSFDPEPIAADIATMQREVDAASVEIATIEALDASYAAKCQAERSAYLGSLLAFGWRAGETVVWAWLRNVPKTYSSLRDASILYGATYALFLRYKECMSGKTNGGEGDA